MNIPGYLVFGMAFGACVMMLAITLILYWYYMIRKSSWFSRKPGDRGGPDYEIRKQVERARPDA